MNRPPEAKTSVRLPSVHKALDSPPRRISREQCLPREWPEALADKPLTGIWIHDRAIIAETPKALALPASTDMPAEVYEFMGLFPHPIRRRWTGRSHRCRVWQQYHTEGYAMTEKCLWRPNKKP